MGESQERQKCPRMLSRSTVCSGGRPYALEVDRMLWRSAVCSGGRQYALEDGSTLWTTAICSGQRQRDQNAHPGALIAVQNRRERCGVVGMDVMIYIGMWCPRQHPQNIGNDVRRSAKS